MGLLDDAIREHLDLKRRRGADPAVIERLEREALGPVRRDPSIAATATEEPPPGLAESVVTTEATDDDQIPRASIVGMDEQPQPKRRGFLHRRPASLAQPAEEPHSDDPVHEHEEPATELHVFDAAAPDEHFAGDEHPAAPASSPPQQEPPHLMFESEAAAQREPTHPLDQPATPAEDSHTESAPERSDASEEQLGETTEYSLAEMEADEQEDVLEETPEFLQDTPEHDRLWFEQRPPKDFDFDG